MKNQTGKYFKYAVGEIVLVVIGILIALSINNWNEKRKARIYETKMLHELRTDLILDTIYFNAIIERPTRARKAIDKLIEMKLNNSIKNDSVERLFNIAGTNFSFTYHKGAYESLKSIGLDKISNDSLRNQISELYDFTFPRTIDLIVPTQEETSLYYKETIERYFVFEFNQNNTRPIPKLKMEPESLFNEARFLNTLHYQKGYTINSMNRLKDLTNSITKLLKHIDAELHIKEPTKNIPIRNWN